MLVSKIEPVGKRLLYLKQQSMALIYGDILEGTTENTVYNQSQIGNAKICRSITLPDSQLLRNGKPGRHYRKIT